MSTGISGSDWNEAVSTGTTILAAEFDGGVVVCSDSRTTMGSYVCTRTTNKLDKLTDHIMVCRSGSAADSQAIIQVVSYRMGMLSMELGEPVSVKIAANDVKQLCYNYRESLLVGTICAGWDRKSGGQVYSIPMGGMISREGCVIGGSGSSYIYGFVDGAYKKGMDKNSCIEFAIKAVSLAMFRDASSGGVIHLATITEKGAELKIFKGDEVPKYYD